MLLILILKVLCLCLFAIGIRGTVPRYRFDQILQNSWKNIIFYLFSFFIFSVLFFFFL